VPEPVTDCLEWHAGIEPPRPCLAPQIVKLQIDRPELRATLV
jgi:hypothetical protein